MDAQRVTAIGLRIIWRHSHSRFNALGSATHWRRLELPLSLDRAVLTTLNRCPRRSRAVLDGTARPTSLVVVLPGLGLL